MDEAESDPALAHAPSLSHNNWEITGEKERRSDGDDGKSPTNSTHDRKADI